MKRFLPTAQRLAPLDNRGLRLIQLKRIQNQSPDEDVTI